MNNDEHVDHYQSSYKSFTPRLEDLTKRNYSISVRNDELKKTIDIAKKTKINFLMEKEKKELGQADNRRKLVAMRSVVK